MTLTARVVVLSALMLSVAGCRIEQRPPVGAVREQVAVQVAVAAYYERLSHGDRTVPRDTAFEGDSFALVRSDVQLQRDLASVFATVRVGPPSAEPQLRIQHLLLRRSGAEWTVVHVASAIP